MLYKIGQIIRREQGRGQDSYYNIGKIEEINNNGREIRYKILHTSDALNLHSNGWFTPENTSHNTTILSDKMTKALEVLYLK